MAGQRNISTWKSRNRISRIADGAHPLGLGTTQLNWGPHEQAALGLALSRFARIHADAAAKDDFAGMMLMASRPADLWTLFGSAQGGPFADMQASGDRPPHSPLAVPIHEDCRHPEDAVRRDRAQIREHQPGVTEWHTVSPES